MRCWMIAVGRGRGDGGRRAVKMPGAAGGAGPGEERWRTEGGGGIRGRPARKRVGCEDSGRTFALLWTRGDRCENSTQRRDGVDGMSSADGARGFAAWAGVISSGRASLVGARGVVCAAAQQEAGEEWARGGGDVKRIPLVRPKGCSLRAGGRRAQQREGTGHGPCKAGMDERCLHRQQRRSTRRRGRSNARS